MKRKCLAIGIILLFLGTCIIPNTCSETSSKDLFFMTMGCFDGIEINGSMGQNGWYRSNVQIIFNFTEGHTHIFYSFDEGNWTEYTAPLVVNADGVYTVWGYYIDMEGNQSEIYTATFKIDQTSPLINGIFSESLGHHTYRIHADVNDTTSGMNRVEYYMNDCLIENISTAPYEWMYKGPNFYLDAISYDNAGNSAMIITSRTPIRYSAIGFIEHPEFSNYTVSFFAKSVLVFDFPSFMTLANQQFFIYTTYVGYIGENFMMIKYRSFF